MRYRFDRSILLQSGACAALFLCALVPVARAQDYSGTQAQINRLENEVQTLSRAVFKGEQPAQMQTQSSSSSGDRVWRARA